MPQQAWTAADLKRRCGEIRGALERRKLAGESELAAYWPGGASNPETHRLGRWIFCYANLVRMLGRGEHTEAASGVVDAAIASSLARDGVRVRLESGAVRVVHPKSYHALRWLDTLDRSLLDVIQMVADLPATTDALKALTIAPLLESQAVRMWAWVLTEGESEDEPATLPFDEASAPELPSWTHRLTPDDLLTLARAHVEVNARRLRIIAEAFPNETGGGVSRLSLAGFLGTVGQELGVRPAELMRRWSLGEVFAQAVSAAQAAREARERAERAG